MGDALMAFSKVLARTRPARLCPARQRGSATVEYVIVALFVVLVLLAAGPGGIQQLMANLREAYSAFVYAMSASWI
jgi:Flp pilus assembly pilin Flp